MSEEWVPDCWSTLCDDDDFVEVVTEYLFNDRDKLKEFVGMVFDDYDDWGNEELYHHAMKLKKFNDKLQLYKEKLLGGNGVISKLLLDKNVWVIGDEGVGDDVDRKKLLEKIKQLSK